MDQRKKERSRVEWARQVLVVCYVKLTALLIVTTFASSTGEVVDKDHEDRKH